jgi:hypothetical protein
VALGDDPVLADALCAAIVACAGVAGTVVLRPLVGVALDLPTQADAALVAHALDAEQVTAGFVDFAGRTCVAVPADARHIAQTAHSVAKVVHLLLELHTAYINAGADACPLPQAAPLPPDALANAVDAILDATSALMQQLADLRQLDAPAELRALIREALALLDNELAAFRICG